MEIGTDISKAGSRPGRSPHLNEPKCKGCPGTLCKGCHETGHQNRACRGPRRTLRERHNRDTSNSTTLGTSALWFKLFPGFTTEDTENHSAAEPQPRQTHHGGTDTRRHGEEQERRGEIKSKKSRGHGESPPPVSFQVLSFLLSFCGGFLVAARPLSVSVFPW